MIHFSIEEKVTYYKTTGKNMGGNQIHLYQDYQTFGNEHVWNNFLRFLAFFKVLITTFFSQL